MHVFFVSVFAVLLALAGLLIVLAAGRKSSGEKWQAMLPVLAFMIAVILLGAGVLYLVIEVQGE